MRYYLTLTIVFINLFIYAQNSTVPSGGAYQGSGGSVSYSIGQPVFHMLNGNGYIIEGVQQPYEISIVSSNESLEFEDHCKISFDAENKSIVVALENFSSLHLVYSISDLQGRVLYESKIIQSNTIIDLNKYSSKIFFLNLLSQENHLKTYKIIIY